MQQTADHQADEVVVEAPGAIDRIFEVFGAAGRHMALLVGCVATGGSLFMSEVLGWPPCVLCWYQRIAMYPLVLVLLVGILRRDNRVALYVVPQAAIGACISLYHYLLIKTDWLPPPACADGIPCNVDFIDLYGFINIPFMALTAFLLIIFTMLASSLAGEPETPPASNRVAAIAAFAIIALVFGGYIALAQVM
jgi:disulfide bond formation protein DsbB